MREASHAPASASRPGGGAKAGPKWATRPAFRTTTACLLFLGLLACGLLNLAAQQKTDPLGPATQWEVLEGCQLRTNATVDGDSFHVRHKDREYVFRLYFVDAPETDLSQRERVEDQAAYFGLATNEIVRAGRLAAKFTRERLVGREFTVITRWQNAMGRGSLARFYGIVLVGGQNLAEELVTNGLARIYGLRANWPDGPRSATFINHLKNRELSAREQKRGVWDEQQFPHAKTSTGTATDGTNQSTNAAQRGAAKVELNSASFEELQTLPGIGPKLAERILAHRPFKTVEDLDKVPGIGAKTIERLRPLVWVENKAR